MSFTSILKYLILIVQSFFVEKMLAYEDSPNGTVH